MEEHGKYGNSLKSIYSYTHLGITFAASIILFLLGGKYLDGKWGTEPYLTLAGAFIGAAAGFYYIIREMIQRSKIDEEKTINHD